MGRLFKKNHFILVAGAGFEPTPSGHEPEIPSNIRTHPNQQRKMHEKNMGNLKTIETNKKTNVAHKKEYLKRFGLLRLRNSTIHLKHFYFFSCQSFITFKANSPTWEVGLEAVKINPVAKAAEPTIALVNGFENVEFKQCLLAI